MALWKTRHDFILRYLEEKRYATILRELWKNVTLFYVEIRPVQIK